MRGIADGWTYVEKALLKDDTTDRRAVLPFELWDILSECAKEDRLAIAVEPLNNSGKARSVLYWAVKASAQSQTLPYFPLELGRRLGALVKQTHVGCRLRPTAIPPLHHLILLAQGDAAYAFAQKSPDSLANQLAHNAQILRQDDVVSVEDVMPNGTSETYKKLLYKYKIALSEPVLQGFYDMQRSSFTAIASPEASTEDDSASTFSIASTTEETEADDYEGDFSVDESFLEQDLLNRSANLWLSTDTIPAKSNGLQAAKEEQTVQQPRFDQPWQDCACLPLLHPVNQDLYISAASNIPWDRHRDIFVRTQDLLRLHLFSGDAVLVRSPDRRTDGPQGHLARVWACDLIFSQYQSPLKKLPFALLPPTLLHNLDNTNSISPETCQIIPFRSLDQSKIPTAKSITVARIASPLSTSKVHEPLFFRELQRFFEGFGGKRMIQEGDVIAVGINEAEAKWAEDSSWQFPATSNTSPTALVFFRITSVLLSARRVESAYALENGEFGCYAILGETKLIQAGIDKSIKPAEPSSGLSSFVGVQRFSGSLLLPKLVDYLAAAVPEQASLLDLSLSILVKGGRGSGKKTALRSAAAQVGMETMVMNCFDLFGESEVKTEGMIRARVERAIESAPCLLVLTNVEALARKAQTVENGQDPPTVLVLQDCLSILKSSWRETRWPVILAATTTDADQLPASVLSCFKADFLLEAPDEASRLAMLQDIVRSDVLSPDVSLRSIAVQSAALLAGDLVDLVGRARLAALQRAQQSDDYSTIAANDLKAAGLALTGADFSLALDKARSSYSESIGAPKIPNVTWDDVGGLAAVKADILDTIQLPLEHPELFAEGLKKRSGILLYGPPGTGKTLLAKAVATSCSLNFFSVKGPELLNMYIGESEANVRRVFQRARDAKPCCIFFDELDSVAPKRGNQGDSGGVMDRIVSQLLAELDGMADGSAGADVFVIGATNRPDLLDPALLRPGRFDRMLYLGVSDNHEAQLRIIQALTRKFKLHPATDLRAVAEQCPFNYTGADFYALCSDAMLKAMTRQASEVDARISAMNASPPYSNGEQALMTPQYYLSEIATAAEIDILVSQQDFEAALAELVPSVSQHEMAHYALVQEKFSAKPKQAQKVDKGKGKAIEM